MKSKINLIIYFFVFTAIISSQTLQNTFEVFRSANITEAQLKKVDFEIRKMVYSNIKSDFRYLKETAPKDGNAVIRKMNNDFFLSTFIKSDNIERTKSEIELIGGKVTNIIGNIILTDLPIIDLAEIVFDNEIIYVEAGRYSSTLLDTSLTFINVDKVHQGVELPKAYKGKDVIVGVVDSGIDWEHPAFSNENGNRILYLWDMSDNTAPPAEFDYGTEYTKEDLDQQNSNQIDDNGHGTHVASTAAGNTGGDEYPLVGVAPEADIVFVKGFRAGSSGFSTNDIVNGCDYIFKRAEQLGKPAVINLSLGSVRGEQGKSLYEEALTNLVKPGRLIVASAGNSGSSNVHLQYQMSGNSYNEKSNTLFGVRDSSAGGAIIMGYPENDNYNIGLQVFDKDFNILYTSPAVSYNEEGNGFIVIDSDTLAQLTVSGKPSSIEPFYFSVLLNFKEDSGIKNYYFNLYTYGSAFFNSWILNGFFYTDTDPSENLIGGDNLMTVGSPSSAFNVFSIGAFSTTLSWTNINGDFVSANGTIKARAPFSSIGPLRDGRIKPDFMAPGHYIAAGYSKDANYNNKLIVNDFIVYLQGTSMSAPHFTGVIALLLEQNPELSYQEAYELLKNTSVVDEITGTVPNNEYGWGRIDAYAALKQLITSVEGEENIPTEFRLSQNYPNPFNPTTSIEYSVPSSEYVSLKVYDILGNEIAELVNEQKSAGTYRVNFDASSMSSGVYFYRIKTGSFNQVRKMMLLK